MTPAEPKRSLPNVKQVRKRGAKRFMCGSIAAPSLLHHFKCPKSSTMLLTSNDQCNDQIRKRQRRHLFVSHLKAHVSWGNMTPQQSSPLLLSTPSQVLAPPPDCLVATLQCRLPNHVVVQQGAPRASVHRPSKLAVNNSGGRGALN